MRRLSVLLLPLAVACAPAAPATTDSPAPTPERAMAAQAWQTGNYRTTVTASELPAGAPADELAGTWELQFHGGNHFVVMRNGAQVLQGPYQVSGNQLTFATGESGAYACNVSATYTWQLSGGQMTFTPVGTDSCRGRAVILANRAFTAAP